MRLSVKFWSVIPMLRYEEGHPYGYNLAVGRACEINQWSHEALVPLSCAINNLPASWHKVLADDFFTEKGGKIICKTPKEKALVLFKSLKPLCFSLLKIKKEKNNKVLFLEQFFLRQIIAFGFAVFFINPNAQIWLLHRYSSKQLGFKYVIYNFIHRLIEVRCGKNNLKLLCDSTLLAQDLSKYFKRDVCIMPIPHTQDPQPVITFDKNEKKLIWWPGAFTTEAKGLKIIKKISKYKNDDFKLIIADSAKEHLTELGVKVEFIESNLPRKDYIQWMTSVDLILLPYDPLIYQFSTSGIFVEAVVAGKIPVVRDGTWMAFELKKFGLQKLIVDWENPNIFKDFKEILEDLEITKKLSEMQNSYKQFHSEATYAKIMNRLFSQ
jgi:hypothetical protein